MARKLSTRQIRAVPSDAKVIRCAIYTRVSVDEKTLDANGVLRGRKEDHSLKMQEDYCRRYLDVRKDEGYVVGEVFVDDGYSAKDQRRPALQRLFGVIENGEVDAVVVYKIDRLTRSVADFYEISRTWFERDLRFVSASQSFDTATVGGRLMLNILLTFAQFEREMISERTQHTHWMHIAEGKWTGGQVPYGFSLKDGELVVVDDLKANVQRIFSEAAEGLSAGEIAAGFRTDEIKRPTKKYPSGKEWDAGSIRSTIANARYCGVRAFSGNEFPTKHAGIVSKELWDLANARLPVKAEAVRKLRKHEYAFVGVGVCGVCGQPLVAYPSKGRTKSYHFYTCRRARKRLGGESCQLGHIRVDLLESLVIEALSILGKHPAIIQATVEAAAGKRSADYEKKDARLADLRTKHSELVAEIGKLEELALDKGRAALAARMLDRLNLRIEEESKLKEQIRILELSLQHEDEKTFNREVIAKALADLGRVIGVLPAPQKRELLQSLVGRLVVKPWDGQEAGISGGAITIAPEIGTRRYSVKISLSESSLLSGAFIDSVDGSTLREIGCPGWDRTSDQVINSHLLYR